MTHAHPDAAPNTATAPIAIFTITMLIALQALSTDMYLPSLPGMTHYFRASVSQVQWTLTLFILAFGCAQLIAGPLSDRFGRRPVALAATGLYVLASVMCALAPALTLLAAGRVLQAIGACSALVCARAIIRDSTTPEEGARTLAKAGAFMAAAPLLGPIVGGFLEAQFNWRATFVVLGMAGTLALWMVSTQITETNRFKDAQALRAERLLDTYRAIAGHRGFWAYTLASTASYGGLVAYLSGSSQVLQTVLGLDPQTYGLGFAVCALGYLIGTLMCRRWLNKIGLTRTLRRGALLALGGGGTLVGLALMGHHHWAAIFGPQALYLAAHGVVQPCAQAGSVAHFPRQAGSAAALMGFVLMMFAAVIVFWMGVSFNATVYPLVFTVFACAFALALAVFWLVQRNGALAK